MLYSIFGKSKKFTCNNNNKKSICIFLLRDTKIWATINAVYSIFRNRINGFFFIIGKNELAGFLKSIVSLTEIGQASQLCSWTRCG